jgi:hypothetical protein
MGVAAHVGGIVLQTAPAREPPTTISPWDQADSNICAKIKSPGRHTNLVVCRPQFHGLDQQVGGNENPSIRPWSDWQSDLLREKLTN